MASEPDVTRALLILTTLLIPLVCSADEFTEGKAIFDRKCSQCHTFEMAQAMLLPKAEAERPSYLRRFLETHPPKLTVDEKEIVIQALSRRD